MMKKAALAGAMSELLGTATHAGCGLSGGNGNILENEFGAIQARVAGAKEYTGDVVTGDANLTKVHRDPQVAALTAKIAAVAPPSEDPDEPNAIGAYRDEINTAIHKGFGISGVPSSAKANARQYSAFGPPIPSPRRVTVSSPPESKSIGTYRDEINTTILKGIGISGALTNGAMRDLGDLPDGFLVVAGSFGPSHRFVHVKEIGTTVNIFDLEINDGDPIQSDRHGALVIPPAVVDGQAAGIQKLRETEKIVLSEADKEGFDFNAFEAALSKFERARI